MSRAIYCISGLGADERVFSRLDVPGIHLLPLPWLTPVPAEPIGDYADRMRAGISLERPVLLGVSFGGMMAIEMAKHIPGATVILLSSVCEWRQLPLWIRAGGRVYPAGLFPSIQRHKWRVPFIERHFIGVESAEDSRLVNEFQEKVDPRYMAWAINTIARWRNEWRPASLFHIHGGKDRMFPLRNVQPTHVVPDGSHLMVFNRPQAVSGILREIVVQDA